MNKTPGVNEMVRGKLYLTPQAWACNNCIVIMSSRNPPEKCTGCNGEKFSFMGLEEEEAPMVEVGNTIYELVFDGNTAQFVHLTEEGKIEYSDFVDYLGKRYCPLVNETVKKRAVILPKKALEYECEEKLVEDVRAFVHKYVDVSDDFELFSAYYVLLSWVFDRLHTVPYLRFIGDFSTGKTRGLDTVGHLCYRPILSNGAVTAAPLYRMQSVWKGTIIIEEADRRKSDPADEVVKILNCGYERNKPVLRCNANDPNDIETHDVFGPKVISSRSTFSDSALESRCITEEMKETKRDDIPNILPSWFYLEQEELRGKLLMYRLRNRNKLNVDIIQEMQLGGADSRIKQAMLAFSVLFGNDPVLWDKFTNFVYGYNLRVVKERESTLDGQIVHYLIERSEANLTKEITPSGG